MLRKHSVCSWVNFVCYASLSGRMLADPAFLYKLLLEQAATIGCSVWWELKNRKERWLPRWNGYKRTICLFKYSDSIIYFFNVMIGLRRNGIWHWLMFSQPLHAMLLFCGRLLLAVPMEAHCKIFQTIYLRRATHVENLTCKTESSLSFTRL